MAKTQTPDGGAWVILSTVSSVDLRTSWLQVSMFSGSDQRALISSTSIS